MISPLLFSAETPEMAFGCLGSGHAERSEDGGCFRL